MSDDGADLNMPAEGAMKAALGGEQPERMTDEEFERKIRTATEGDGYDGTATYAARLVLEFLEAHPEHRNAPISNVYQQPIDWSNPVILQHDLYDVMKEAGVPLGDLDLTGFMWGWAFNAAHKVLGLDPQPNPAIITIG